MAGVVVPPISDHMYGDLHSIQFQYNSPVVNSSWASMPASGFPQVVVNSNGSATMGGAQSEPADILGGNFNEQEAIGLRNSDVATTQSENCFDYAIMATLPSTSEAFSQAGSTANHKQSDILISHVLDAEAMPHVSPDGQPCIADYELGSASPLAGMETLSVLGNPFKAQDCSMLPACHEDPLPPLSGSHMKLLQREAAYAAAAMQPVDWGSTLNVDVGARPKRRNVRISQDPQTASARRRRERISDRIRVLQRMVPGGMKMDTASLLDEAIHYLKYLKSQVQTLEWLEKSRSSSSTVNRLTSGSSCPSAYSGSYSSFVQHSGSRTLLQMIK